MSNIIKLSLKGLDRSSSSFPKKDNSVRMRSLLQNTKLKLFILIRGESETGYTHPNYSSNNDFAVAEYDALLSSRVYPRKLYFTASLFLHFILSNLPIKFTRDREMKLMIFSVNIFTEKLEALIFSPQFSSFVYFCDYIESEVAQDSRQDNNRENVILLLKIFENFNLSCEWIFL